jgi:hypothetical protein
VGYAQVQYVALLAKSPLPDLSLTSPQRYMQVRRVLLALDASKGDICAGLVCPGPPHPTALYRECVEFHETIVSGAEVGLDVCVEVGAGTNGVVDPGAPSATPGAHHFPLGPR